MKKKKKYGVIPRKYDISLDIIYEKIEQEKIYENLEKNILAQNYLANVCADNEIDLPSSYILMGQDTNKDSVVDDSDIKVDTYGGLSIRVEDQESSSLCWAFAAMKSLETNLMLNVNTEYDFSERHIDYMQSNLFRNKFRSLNAGGNFVYFENYINSEDGPVLETEVPFDSDYSGILDYEYLESLSSRVKVDEENFINMPSINKETTSYTDEELEVFRKMIKEHIMKNGSLAANIYSVAIVDSLDGKNKVLNYQEDHIADHSISIIGWDDNFSKENFPENCRPNSDGAYIALNSYGDEWGNCGIFYISYEDILVESNIDGVSNAYVLDVLDIYVETEPDTVDYIVGENFSAEGMIVKAKYQNGEEKEIVDYTISPEVISKNTKYITISYTVGNSTKTTTQKINIYDVEENLEDGMKVYCDNTNKIMTVNGTGELKTNLENYNVEKIIFEEGINGILSNTINGLSQLKSIYILDRECVISDNAITNNSVIVYCYKESTAQEYCENNNIAYFAYDNYYKCGKEAYAFLNETDKKIIISGAGKIDEYKLNEIPWKSKDEYINIVEIDDGIVNISNKLFAENSNIQTVKLGNNVTEIGEYVFYDCTNLSQVELNDELEKINKCVFYNCTSLDEINIPDSVTNVGEYCFYNCTSLVNVKLSSKMKTLEDYTFYNCTSLKEIDIPDEISMLYKSVFQNCTSLENVKFPKKINVIGNWTFANCTSLKEVDLSECSPTRIQDATFNGCSSLESFIMPESITNISQGIFGKCTSLKTLQFSHGITRLWNGVAQNCSALEELSIPYGIKIIGERNFSGGTNLKRVVLPCSLETIGSYNFAYCNKLESLIIPHSVIFDEEVDLLASCKSNPTIYCKSGSNIEEYAINNGINYKIDDIKPSVDVSKKLLDSETIRINVIASDDNDIVGLSDYPYSFDGGVTWQHESYIDVSENESITICVRDAVGNIETVEVTVEEIKINICNLSCSDVEKVIYTGKAQVPKYTITDGDYTLVENVDYTVEVSDNTNIGIATVIITGKNEYEGQIVKSFVIEPADITVLEWKLDSEEVIYEGVAVEPEVKLNDENFSEVYKENIKVTYMNNTEPGTASIIIEGINNFTGKVTKEFKINKLFKDVPETEWYFKAVKYCKENEIILGYGETREEFKPNEKMTRGMFVTILYRMAGVPDFDESLAKEFPDVHQDWYYARAIKWASAVGIVNGFEDGTFGPDKPIIRQDLAIMIRSFARVILNKDISVQDESKLLKFKDYTKIDNYAKESALWAVENKVMNGTQEGYLNPHGIATRAETAAMLYNYLENNT